MNISGKTLVWAMLLLGACAPPWQAPPPAPASPPEGDAEMPRPRAKPTGKPRSLAPAGLVKPTPRLEPRALMGLAPEQAEFILGRPASVRKEPPATVWSYRSGACALDLFFYAGVRDRALKSLAYDVTAPDETDEARAACFDRIVATHRDRR